MLFADFLIKMALNRALSITTIYNKLLRKEAKIDIIMTGIT